MYKDIQIYTVEGLGFTCQMTSFFFFKKKKKKRLSND
jgi:hypothetical protein